MGINIELYRAAIGRFHLHVGKKSFHVQLFFWQVIYTNFLFYHWVLPNIIKQCNDIESNPGPVSNSHKPTANFQIGHVNMRSIKAPIPTTLSNNLNTPLIKMDLLKAEMTAQNYNILGISETWLDNTFDENKLLVEGYQRPIRRDNTSHSCGSMLYIANNTPATRKIHLEPTDSEIICVELQIKKIKVLVCSCYRPQHRDIIDFCYDIETILDNGSDTYQSYVFIGDMNARNKYFWDKDLTNTEGRALKAFFDQHNFSQLINEATRVQNGAESCIDLLFTNTPSLFTSTGTRPKVYDTCDHKPIFATLKGSFPKQHAFERWVWNYDQGDMIKFQTSLLNAPWLSCYNPASFDDTLNAWSNLFIKTAETSIPHYQATIRPKDKEFMNSYIRQLMTKRDRMHKQLKRNPNNENLKYEYREIRKTIVTEIGRSKFGWETKRDKILSEGEFSNRKWWKFAKTLITTSSPPSINDTPLLDGNDIISDDLDKANLINKFLVQQSTLDDSNASLPDTCPEPSILIEQKVIQPEEVYEILVNLDTTKATGPDGISNRLLKEAAVSISEPLSHLFNYSLSIGYFPEQWKIANVIPIFKKDNPMICNNYRPISLLSCVSKVFEKILFNHIYTFLKQNKLLNRNQSGFTPGDGTINQLINICNKIYSQFDKSDEVLAVFLDLSKAFDKVWHKGLIYKLKKIGITGNLLKWLISYLSNRKQQVVINGAKSDILDLKSGVPQGSVLGPLLFLIYINDLTDGITGEVFLFADDSSLFHTVRKNINTCAAKMNYDLNIIYQWANKWLVTINAIKTVFILFSSRRPNIYIPPIMLGSASLNRVYSHKHLGLILTSNLSWGEHISQVIAKANKRLFVLKYHKYKLSQKALATCYTSFVRPLIEYGDILYDSCTQEQSESIEKLQHEAARIATGAKFRSSPNLMYKELGWCPLEDRRKTHKLTKIYSIKNKIAPSYLCEILESFQHQHRHPTSTARNTSHLKHPVPKKEMYNKSFFISAIKEWNKLDQLILNAPSLNAFKHKLAELNSVKPYFMSNTIDRKAQIIIAQLRLEFSDLNSHLHKKGCTQSPVCQCGYPTENTYHFLISCPQYREIRDLMMQKINNLHIAYPINVDMLLFGTDLNENVYANLQEYLSDMLIASERFLNYQITLDANTG